MNHYNLQKKKQNYIEQFNLININLDNIKSNYLLKIIFDSFPKYRALSLIKYNKKLQNRLNLSIKEYKEYSEIFTPIEIEMKTIKNIYGQFINILKKEDELYFHIYFDNKQYEEKRNYINIMIKFQILK